MGNKRDAELKKQRKAKADAARQGKTLKKEPTTTSLPSTESTEEALTRPSVLDFCAITGVRTSQPLARDIRIEQFTISMHGREYIQDTVLELNHGHRYGLIGQNGSGKSTLLTALAHREVAIPDHVDIWHLHKEAEPSDRTALESVVDVVADEQKRLEDLMMKIIEEDPENDELMNDIGERLDKLDPSTFEKRAGELLHGLGFTLPQMHKATKDMSGGWRMRVALAQALFVSPTLLLLDEPTNHLDLEACVWLENYLATYDKMLIVISHSQDFLNGVCTKIMHLVDGKFTYYGGNYESFVKTKSENEVNQLKRYEKEQADIKHLKAFISSCGTYANLVKQAQSKQKIIDKMTAAGLTEKPRADAEYSFKFPSCDKIPPPVMSFTDVSFSYSGHVKDYLYKHLDFGVDLDSRIALVGPNGAGKSTLLKLMEGQLEACEGTISRNGHLRIGRYNQHSTDQLDLNATPLEFMRAKFASGIMTREGPKVLDEEQWRQKLGAFGLTGAVQKQQMSTMSHGMVSRVVFCLISISNPHILLLDEPTNHLDMGCIDSLAKAIRDFDGGLVLVSHDFRLISQVANEIWVCDGSVQKWNGDITSYKKHLIKSAKKFEL